MLFNNICLNSEEKLQKVANKVATASLKIQQVFFYLVLSKNFPTVSVVCQRIIIINDDIDDNYQKYTSFCLFLYTLFKNLIFS